MRYVLLLLLLVGCGHRRKFPSHLADRNYPNGHTLVLNRAPSAMEDELFDLTNAYRATKHLGPFLRRSSVNALALAHSKHMRDHLFYAHENPEGDDPYERLNTTEAGSWGIGENIWIVASTETAQYILDGFIASPHHNANLLHTQVHFLGVGMWDDGMNNYVTMDFVVD